VLFSAETEPRADPSTMPPGARTCGGFDVPLSVANDWLRDGHRERRFLARLGSGELFELTVTAVDRGLPVRARWTAGPLPA
jgi:hypothetical protein